MPNRLDPDQARLDPNCLQRLSADDTGRQGVKEAIYIVTCIYVCTALFKVRE